MAEDNVKGTHNNNLVYNETTKPRKPKHRNKSDLGEDFIAPDGGWAWVVCIAAGFANFSIFPMLQQFGLIFRGKLFDMGLSSSEITSIINVQYAISAITGLLNGPMFRRFTFRQVALVGPSIMFVGILCSAFVNTFPTFLIFFSILVGFGMGISMSAATLAVNTYFKVKRRKAMGFTWTISGMGPIFLPHLITFLLVQYGVQGTIIIFSALTLNAFVCGLLYQPVRWHTKPPPSAELKKLTPEADHKCQYCQMSKRKNTGIFSSQYFYQDDDENNPGFETTDPVTPMLARANDGWFGSKMSLTSIRQTARLRTLSISTPEPEKQLFFKPNNFNREKDVIQRQKCTCTEERELLQKNQAEIKALEEIIAAEEMKNVSFLTKVVAFFDLSLLKDPIYVNLLVGMTVINFGEMNFAALIPFILYDFGLSDKQISFAISLYGITDVTARFLIPFITAKIKWDNRVFFSIGILGIVIGRTVIACTRSYPVILMAFVWTGFSKGIRTIFWPLIIPGYVPLKRLPAASGLQLLVAGIFTLACGPFVGLIRDKYNYSIVVHIINILTFSMILIWIVEALFRSHRRKRTQMEQC